MNQTMILAYITTLLLHRITRLPTPALFLGFPKHSGIHDLGFQSFDDKDGRLLFADEHTPDLNRIERNIDQDKFSLRRYSMPSLFTAAKNHQQMVCVLRISAKGGA